VSTKRDVFEYGEVPNIPRVVVGGTIWAVSLEAPHSLLHGCTELISRKFPGIGIAVYRKEEEEMERKVVE
jgi:hypothetical protein